MIRFVADGVSSLTLSGPPDFVHGRKMPRFFPGPRHSHFGDVSAPPLRDEPAALVRRHLTFLDRAGDSRLSIGRVVDDVHQLRYWSDDRASTIVPFKVVCQPADTP